MANPPDEDRTAIIGFGTKHKGKSIDVIRREDPQYLEWLIAQAWFRQKFPAQYTLIVSYGASNDNTPQHNAMQARFLDDGLCFKAAVALVPELCHAFECCEVEYQNPHTSDGWRSDEKLGRAHLGAGAPAEWSQGSGRRRAGGRVPARLVPREVRRSTEYQGWDWLLGVGFVCSHCGEAPSVRGANYSSYGPGAVFGLELKPTIGDDYPAVIRQVKQHGIPSSAQDYRRMVIVGRYTGEGASFVDVRRMFAAANMHLFTMAEVEAAEVPAGP